MITFLVALTVAFAIRGPGAVVGVALLAVLFVPLERACALRRRRVLRPGLLTDLTHLLANATITSALTVAGVVVSAIPLWWLRPLDLEAHAPPAVTVPLAVALVVVGQYWGHRFAHEVPALWRFHAVHHSIEEMDWVAAARLHPVDQAVSQTFTVMPLFLLGYSGLSIGGVSVAVALLALFQHANVRLRFPGLRWVVNTPEWHHWHHASDPDARDRNFGLPLVDLVFGTAYLPRGRRPAGFGPSGADAATQVPATGYLRQLAHPFLGRGAGVA